MIKSPSSNPVLISLLKECSEWVYSTPYSDNLAEDKSGGIVWEKNKNRDIWCFPGYFNTLLKGDNGGEPKVTRNIKMPRGKKIFCMVASSHATKFEARVMQKSLIECAREIHDLWGGTQELKVDGSPQGLDYVEVPDVSTVDLPNKSRDPYGKDHPYIKYYEDLKVTPGLVEMAHVADVKLLDPLSPGTHNIDFYALSPGKASIGDIAYEVSLRYAVTVA